MKNIFGAVSTLLVVVSLIVAPTSLQAEDLIDQSSNVFNFQHKLALNGNVHAQHKLATMYEKGEGVKADAEQAKRWYTKAASAGSTPAKQRLTYLEIRQTGYKPAQHKPWLDSVIKEAGAYNADSTYLLAQLYSQGIGVKKDLNKSLELYDQVAILGSANVEKEITEVRSQIALARKDKVQERKKQQQVQARQQQQEKLQAEQEKLRAEQQKLNAEAEKVKQAEANKLALEEKRRRYEAVMLKIKQEQQLIDEQQAAATGKEVASIDDEI